MDGLCESLRVSPIYVSLSAKTNKNRLTTFSFYFRIFIDLPSLVMLCHFVSYYYRITFLCYCFVETSKSLNKMKTLTVYFNIYK